MVCNLLNGKRVGGKSSSTGSRHGCFIYKNGVVHSVDWAAIERSLARDCSRTLRRFGPWMAKYGTISYPGNGSGSGEESKGPGGASG